MATYNSYAEAKIANPESAIFSGVRGDFATRDDELWFNECNPAYHCSTIEEFLAAGFMLAAGDIYIDEIIGVTKVDWCNPNQTALPNDNKRYILSAKALGGGCKIPPKQPSVEWSIYNNTLPMRNLSDAHAAELFNAWRGGQALTCLDANGAWIDNNDPRWCIGAFYRVKKSDRELFIEAVGVALSNTALMPVPYAEMLFDSGKFKLVD